MRSSGKILHIFIRQANQKKRAFTLVEILIVVAVIGILFVTLVPRIDFAGDKARETGVKTDFRSFELAAEQILRKNAGLGDLNTAEKLCDVNGINLYLDKYIPKMYHKELLENSSQIEKECYEASRFSLKGAVT